MCIVNLNLVCVVNLNRVYCKLESYWWWILTSQCPSGCCQCDRCKASSRDYDGEVWARCGSDTHDSSSALSKLFRLSARICTTIRVYCTTHLHYLPNCGTDLLCRPLALI